jgi:hypothetical protein
VRKRLNILLLERSSRFSIELVNFLSLQPDVEHVLYASDYASGYEYIKDLAFHVVFIGIPLTAAEQEDLVAIGKTRVHCTFIRLSETNAKPHIGQPTTSFITYNLEKDTCTYIIPEILETEARSYFTQPPLNLG